MNTTKIWDVLGDAEFWKLIAPLAAWFLAKAFKCSDAEAMNYLKYAYTFVVGMHLRRSGGNGQLTPATDNNSQKPAATAPLASNTAHLDLTKGPTP